MKRHIIFGLLFVFVFVFSFAFVYAVDHPPIPEPGNCCMYYLPTCGWAWGAIEFRGGDWICTCAPMENPNHCPLICAPCW
jgi:hypothetical protein